MMRCPSFTFHTPRSVEEAVAILAAEGPSAMVLAGGTDVVPGMKRRTVEPRALVSLRRLGELRGISVGDGGGSTALGAAMTLADVAQDPLLRSFGALQRAAAQVATTHIRNVGTVGGNLCVDTRCNYYDQNHEWRKSIDFCMKKQGDVCWVAPGSPRCWAVSSTDLAPALVALGAEVTLASLDGARTIPLAELYADDGIAYLTKRPDELLVDLRLGSPARWRSTYWKLRRREAFDFPVLGVAVALQLDGDRVEHARIVFGAVASHPVSTPAALRLVGQRLTDELIDSVADEASKLAKPLDNTDFALGWRKRVAKGFVAGALRELRGDDPATLGLLARRAAGLRVMQSA